MWSAQIRAVTARAALVALVAVGGLAATSTAADAVTTTPDIAYAPANPAGSRGHLLDLYVPDGTGPWPLVVWSTGSAWTSDDGKSGANAIAQQLNPRGIAVAGVSVRSSSQAKFPAQVHDVKAAIRYLRANADRYRIDPDRFATMGDSSGGWVAAMGALTGGVAALEGQLGTTGVSSSVQAGVDFFGPTDFIRLAQQDQGGWIDHNSPDAPEAQLLGCAIPTCPDKARQADPIRYVDANDPPMLLLHGRADNVVPHAQTEILYDALKAACVDTRFFSVPGAGHSHADVTSASRYGQQTVRTTDGCRETVTQGSPNPSWDTIAAFLKDAWADADPGPGPTDEPTDEPTDSTTSSPAPEPQGRCTATYTVVSSWPGGFVAEVKVVAGSSAIDGWRVAVDLPSGSATNVWSGQSTGGSQITVSNAPWNGRLGAGQSTVFGFQGTGSGAGATVTCLAG